VRRDDVHVFTKMTDLCTIFICKLKSHVVVRRFDYNIAKLGDKYGVIC